MLAFVLSCFPLSFPRPVYRVDRKATPIDCRFGCDRRLQSCFAAIAGRAIAEMNELDEHSTPLRSGLEFRCRLQQVLATTAGKAIAVVAELDQETMPVHSDLGSRRRLLLVLAGPADIAETDLVEHTSVKHE